MKRWLNPICAPISRRAPEIVGSPLTLVAAFASVVIWLLTGPLFGFSGNWLLIPATITSVGAFLVVFLLQYSQNRDTRAIQLKLDELIRSLGAARTQLVRLEHLSDEELEELEHEFRRLREDTRHEAPVETRRRES
jgi:low affinity Fe/Cu permease